MKTNTKIEIGILAFGAILSLIFQVYIKSVSSNIKMEDIEYSGELITKDFPITGFTKLNTNLDFKVEYHIGEPRVEVTTDEGFAKKIIVEQEGGELNLYNENSNNTGNKQIRRVSIVKIFNNQPIELIKTGHNSSLSIKDINLARVVRFETRGNSTLNGSITVDSIYIDSDGNSSVNLDGAAKFGNIDSNGNSHYNLNEMKFTSLELYSNGNSGGEVKVLESVVAKANGNSHVTIIGDPTKTRVNSSGNAHINMKE